ncbi:DDE superfamily endonuclease [Pseudovibrio sp. Tun.PSC04-5.I4]|nr:DDE superfamily endonuclease [Pseudovibrio sp. Tun.PSC04-5.I4]
MILKRETGGLEPLAQGNGGGHGKFVSLRGWIEARMFTKLDLTLNYLVSEFADHHNVAVHRVSLWWVLRSRDLAQKNDLQAAEQKRPDIWQSRDISITHRQFFMRNLLSRIGFIDEIALKTNMTKTMGWSPKGSRLIDYAPFGHWKTRAFIATLRHDRLEAPWVLEGAMNGKLFDFYIVIHMHYGSADQTKTSTVCYASIYHVALICLYIPKQNLMQSQDSSTSGHARPCNIKPS